MKKIPHEITKEIFFNQFLNNQTNFKIWEEQINNNDVSNYISPLDFGYQLGKKETGRYHLAIITPVTEKLVGISSNENKLFNVPWEADREETYNNQKYIVFIGWGDAMSGENINQFEGKEIMILIGNIRLMFARLVSSNPNYFEIEKVNNIIGLESLNLH